MATQAYSPGLLCPNTPSDQRCLSTKCGSTTLVDFMYNPSWLFDSQRTPTIHLGPASIPGPLLPLLISTIFIHHSSLWFRARRNRQVEIGRPPPLPNRDDMQWPDLRHPDAMRIYFAKANLAFHGVVTGGAIMHFGRSFLDTNVLCCTQVAALLLYAEFIKPETRRSCLAAATGWTLFTFLDQMSGVVAVAATCTVALLAAPIAWQIDGVRGDMEHQQSASGLLLMLMVAVELAFDSQVAAQQWAQQDPKGVGASVTALHGFNGLMTWVFNRNGEARRWDTNWDLQEIVAGLGSIMTTLLDDFCVLAAFLVPLAGGVVCTAYISSCLPWSGLMFGKCASSPSLSLFSIATGLLVHITIWMIVHTIMQARSLRPVERTPTAILRTQLKSHGYAIGWACTLLNFLWVALGLIA